MGQGTCQSCHHVSPAASMVWHRIGIYLWREWTVLFFDCLLRLSSQAMQPGDTPYSWGPLALLGGCIWFISTDCLLVLQHPRLLRCPASMWKEPRGQSLLFLRMLHHV